MMRMQKKKNLISIIFVFSLIFIQTFIHPSKYALIGAAAHLGGTLRMTISLTVILIETTGNISFALPLIITLISAKWMGDYINEGIYDTLIKLSKAPMLSWCADRGQQTLKAWNIMNRPAVCLRICEPSHYIVDILKTYSYNGFPVVDQVDEVRFDLFSFEFVTYSVHIIYS